MNIFDQSVIWDEIIMSGVATEEELKLVTDVAGYTVEVLNAVVYSRTGYNNIEQLMEGKKSEQERCETCGQWVRSGSMYYNEDNDRAECEACAFE